MIALFRLALRHKRVTSLVFVLGCTISFPVPPAMAAEPTTIYVGDEVAAGAGGSCVSPDLSTFGAADNLAIQSALALVTADADDALDTVHICPGEYTLEETLEAAGNFNLVGSAAATTVLNGSGTIQLLVATGDETAISNISFIDGSSSENDGGAIYAAGDLTVTDSLFEGNYAASVGGAMAVYGSLVVHGSDFTGNSALFDGGAIWGPSVEISTSEFEGNIAGSLGGAIFSSDFVTATDSSFTENSADFGGALYSQREVSIDGGSLSGNVATGDGGAIWGDDVSVESAVIRENCAAAGGAVYATDTLYATTSLFEDNCGSAPSFGLELTIVRRGIVLNSSGSPPCTSGVCLTEHDEQVILTGDPTSVVWSATEDGSMDDAICEAETCVVSRAVESAVLIDLGSTYEEENVYKITATFAPRSQFTVGVEVVAGVGTVSDGASLNCNQLNPPSCTAEYDEGTTVTIIATPAEGYEVAAWSGAAAASCADDRCTFAGLSATKSVAVTFGRDEGGGGGGDGGGGGGGGRRSRLVIEPPRFGGVEVLDPLSYLERVCRADAERCEYRYRNTRVLTLTLRDLPSGASARWIGCSDTSGGTCTIRMTSDRLVRVRIRQEWTSLFKRGEPIFRSGVLATVVRGAAEALARHGSGERLVINGFAKKRLSLARDRARALRRALRAFGVMSPIGFDVAIAPPSERKARAVLSLVWNGRT